MSELLSAVLDLNDTPFAKGANRAVSALDKVEKKSKATSDTLSKLGGYAAQYFAVDKILDFGTAITSTSGKFEKFGSILTNALQSGSGSKDQLRNLTEFAANTPNQLDELTGSFIKFVNRGLIPSKQQLTNFGDLAASQGKGFDQLTEAILDAQTGEFERLKEFGVRASKSGDQVTLSFKGVSQTVKATSGNITEAIQKFGQLTGVAGSMSAVAQTQEGMVSNLSDTYDRLLVALGESGVSGAYKGAIMIASEFLTTITDLIANSPVDDLRNQQAEINGLVGAIALANDNETVRLSLIQKLNQNYPEFLGKLDAESVTTDLLAKRLANVNDQYERKIRIALGQEKIKKVTDDLTRSIAQQQNAFELLAKSSGKSVIDLERLSPKQRIDLAKQVSEKNKGNSFRPSYFGQSAGQATDYLPAILESATRNQAEAQAELNRLMGENATRQADLTKVTVSGYDAQIKQIQQKIRLHKIDAKVGADEIKRLEEASKAAQGIATPKDATPIGSGAAKKQTSFKSSSTDEILERFIKETEKGLANSRALTGFVSPEVVHSLENAEAALRRIRGEAEKTQNLKPLGESLISLNLQGEAGRIAAFTDGFKARINDLKQYGSLNFYREQLDKIREAAAQISLKNLTLDPSAVANLREAATQIAKANAAQKRTDKIANDAMGLAEMKLDPSREDKGAVGNIFSSAGVGAGSVEQMMKQLSGAKDAINLGVGEVASAMESGRGQLKQAAVGLLTSMGEAIGKGENPLKAGLKTILDMLGGYLEQLGAALLFSSAAMLAAAPLTFGITLAPGLGQQIAGGLLIAGGAAVKGFAGSFEGGGLFTGESFIRVAESSKAIAGGGEFVSPVNLGAELIGDRIAKKFGGTNRQSAPAVDVGANLIAERIMNAGGFGGELTTRVSGNHLLFILERAGQSGKTYGNG